MRRCYSFIRLAPLSNLEGPPSLTSTAAWICPTFVEAVVEAVSPSILASLIPPRLVGLHARLGRSQPKHAFVAAEPTVEASSVILAVHVILWHFLAALPSS